MSDQAINYIVAGIVVVIFLLPRIIRALREKP